jgi:peptide/nickel transport system permease protein
MGIDQNYIEQWWSWATGIVRGDFGTSIIGGRSVGAELKRRIPASIELGMLAMMTSIMVALPIGVLSAVRQILRWTMCPSFAIAMLALPSFRRHDRDCPGACVQLFVSIFKGLWKDPIANLLVLVPR